MFLLSPSHVKNTKTRHIYFLTYSMVQSPSWEGNWFAASQEILRISRNPKVHYRTNKLRHLSLPWASPIQSIHPHPTSWRSILILSTHLCLGLPSGLLPSGFPSNTLYTPLSSPIRAAKFIFSSLFICCTMFPLETLPPSPEIRDFQLSKSKEENSN